MAKSTKALAKRLKPSWLATKRKTGRGAEGAIRINGIDVRDAKLDSLSERIGIVTQDAYLFHDTSRANLLYAKLTATDEQIRSALHDAQILHLVESLPDKLNTMVGERGYRFSGGEKQPIAIARLLLKTPDIVILDEAPPSGL